MILQENGARFCVAGKIFAVGGRVMANKESEYEGLFGTITEIRSGADRETENDTPDIYCDFEPPASEEMLRDVYGTAPCVGTPRLKISPRTAYC
jgi:hypothetical protein